MFSKLGFSDFTNYIINISFIERKKEKIAYFP